MFLQILSVVLFVACLGHIDAEHTKESVQSISHPSKIYEVFRLFNGSIEATASTKEFA